MCGIVAILNGGTRQTLLQMTETLAHRGPDAQGIEWFAEDRTGLGHRRLAILDLSAAGNQPMSDPSGRYWIVYNGEIYNYRELRQLLLHRGYRFRSQTDTEVLLYGWIEWGPQVLDRCNGMFAFLIYDAHQKTAYFARDRLGIKPLYYAVYNGTLLVASEIKALLAANLFSAEPDYTALCTPTRFQITPYTGFRNIRKLPAGNWAQWRNGELSISPYWDIQPEEKDIPEQDALLQLEQLLQEAVAYQMIADVPVGVFLSGGLDSSIVAALMRQQAGSDIHSFTIAFTPEDQRFEKIAPDHLYAQQLAEQFGFHHHELVIRPDVVSLFPKMVWHLDEPIGDPAAINTYLICSAAREQFGIYVLLNGVGGDELFGGYRKYIACLQADVYHALLPSFLHRILHTTVQTLPVASSRSGFRILRWIKRFLQFADLPRYERYLSSDLSFSPQQFARIAQCGDYYKTHFYQSQKTRFEHQNLSYLTQMCWNDTKVFLCEHNLTYTDKASMAASVETRPPLLDHRIVEFLFSLPPKYRIHHLTQKYLLKKVAEKYLPKSIIYRPKAPFASPLRSWIRNALAPLVDDLLSEESIRRRGIFRPEAVRQLIEEDRTGKQDHALAIWTLLTVEQWFRIFIDGGGEFVSAAQRRVQYRGEQQ